MGHTVNLNMMFLRLLGNQIEFLLLIVIHRDKRDKQGTDDCVGMLHAIFSCKEKKFTKVSGVG